MRLAPLQAASALMDPQYSFWKEAVAEGRGVDTEPGNPRSGFYRYKGEAVAFWRDEAGALLCWRSGGRIPTKPDEIDDLFAFCAPHPITHEAYQAFVASGRWPEDVEPPAPLISLEPHEAIALAIDELKEQAAAWLADIGKIATQADADKAGNYAEYFAKFERQAVALHKAEKAPFLEGGHAVDAKWNPVMRRAGMCKRWAKDSSRDYMMAERLRLEAEEEARATAEGRPARKVNAKAGTQGRAMAVRTRQIAEIVNLRELLEYWAQANVRPVELVEVCQVIVNRMADSGMVPPGVEIKTIQEIA
jgi:hypothetical protein